MPAHPSPNINQRCACQAEVLQLTCIHLDRYIQVMLYGVCSVYCTKRCISFESSTWNMIHLQSAVWSMMKAFRKDTLFQRWFWEFWEEATTSKLRFSKDYFEGSIRDGGNLMRNAKFRHIELGKHDDVWYCMCMLFCCDGVIIIGRTRRSHHSWTAPSW